jgi:uncharacterized protein
MLRTVAMVAWLIVVAGALEGANAQVSADSAKRVAIRQLLRIQQTDSQMLAGMDLALSNETPDPSLPAGFMDSVRVRARRNIGRFVERLVPVYDSLYTTDEVAQLIRLFQSPIGQRLIATQSALAQATMEIGRQWGMELAGEVIIELSRQPRRP